MRTVQRDCPTCPDLCQDRHARIRDLLYRVRDAAGGTMGLVHRYAEQIAPGAQGTRTLAPVARGVMGVWRSVATGNAILSPFEGPAGGLMVGAATAAAWRRALPGAARVVVP